VAIILLVEDDPVSRRAIAAFLRMTGYEVYEAEDGEAALRLLSRMPFDFVISDLNLPGPLNGIDVLAALRAQRRKVDAILITGNGSRETRDEVRSLGAVYMEKPVQLEEIERTIQLKANG
jgi:two-component system, OmpR family, response regulator